MNYLNPDSENRELPSKLTMIFRRGEVFREEVAGAGGWGDPLERDPALVLKDVRNGFASLRSAREDYGVAIDAAEHVDMAATAELRRAMRAGAVLHPHPNLPPSRGREIGSEQLDHSLPLDGGGPGWGETPEDVP